MDAASYFGRATDRTRFLLCAGCAVLLHALAFTIGGLALATKPEYGMAGAVARGGPPRPVAPPAADTVVLDDESPVVTVHQKHIPQPAPTPVPAQAVGGPSSGGALAVPSYFQNPPPPYPEEARRLREEGLAVLHVEVDAQGNVTSAVLKQSTGFPPLDDSALATVKTWKFKPARMGGIPVSTSVDIPVRFKLEDTR